MAIYLGWQTVLMTVSLANLLAAATPGPTPSLECLRAEFRHAIQADLDETLSARMRNLYPVPLLTDEAAVGTQPAKSRPDSL